MRKKIEEILKHSWKPSDRGRQDFDYDKAVDQILNLIDEGIGEDENVEHPNGNCYQCGREDLRKQLRAKLGLDEKGDK